MLMPTTTTDPPDKTEQQNVEPIKLSTTSPQPFDSFPTFRKTTTTFRAHRRQIKLGPYLLLQTLGEGEFGKVKLAVHTQTGQEFAIKLIRKETVGCSASRLNKVEREIHALKTLKHPYIVKLFNVVETEKYIGIILEYASGGELFEYILAHRSLKEKDARRLFAQLISSVHYMHRKKIVHRDLKLENLLLDRHRNIIVTDFGFANQFSSKEDDLMATSCGSPCYAAPELVVNDGLYAGSSVDIWSCGVILYAMLCGYLPFDDDPCNPDGNNISLLYRYILTNPPAFPKHISAEAQDLLSQMLVPDPSKRCTLETIEQHPWLKQYRSLFEKTDDELEKEAAVAAEQSFIPSYRRMVWSNSQATNTCNEGGGGGDHDENGDDDQKAVDTENVSIIAPLKEMKADTAAGEKKNKGGGVTEDHRSRPATVHAATLRRLTVGRPAADKIGIPTYRNRKARTAIVVDNNSNSIYDHSSPRRRPPCPFPTESSPVTPKPTKAQLPRRERLLSFFTGTKYQPSHVRKRCASMAPPPTTLSAPTTPTKTDKEGPKQNDSTAMELSSAAAAAATATQQPHHQFETLMPSKLRSKFMASLRMRRKDPAKPVLASEIQDSIQAHRQESLKALTSGMNEKSMTLGIHSGRMAAKAVMSKNNKKEAVTHGSGRTDRARNTNNRHSLDPATLVGMVASIDTPSSPPPPPPTPSQHHQQIKSKTGKVMAWIKRRSQGKDRRQSAETTVTTQSFSSNSNNPAVSSNLPPPPSVSPPSPPVLDDNEVIKPGSHTMVGLSEMIDNNVQQAESKLRVHHGALDKTALTSKSPDQLMIQVSHTLCALGIVIKNDGDYTLKCVRPKAKVHQAPRLPPSAPNMLTATMTTTTTTNNGTSCSDDDEDDESIEDDDEDAQTAPSVQSLFPDPGHLSAASSIVQEDEEEKGEEAEEEAGERIPKPSSHSLLSISSNTSQQQHQQSGGAYDNMPRSFTEPIYGNPTIDSGEEIRFIVEICRFRNLPGLYILDIRRIRGNVWAYKFVYHKLLDLLNLGEGGGYLQHQQRPGAGIVDTAATSAAENKYGVLRSSPFLVKPLPPPLLKDSAVYGIASEKQQQQQAPQMVSP